MRVYNIKVNGKKYKVEVIGISEAEPVKVEKTKVEVQAKAEEPVVENKPEVSEGNKTVDAPLQGTILEIKVKVGDEIKKGQTVAILEAMKLENEVVSTVSGKVLEIKVSKSQQVNNKQVLLVVG